MTRWVKRNEDKPHRCPECHSIVTHNYKKAGPKTVVKCLECGVKWRLGGRMWKLDMATKRWVYGPYHRPLYWFTVQRFGRLNR